MQSISDITQVGPLWTTLIFYGIGYALSKKRVLGWQIGVAVLLISFAISDDATLLGQMWAGAYVAGVVSHKVGIWYGIFGSMKFVRERLMNFSQRESRQKVYQKQHAQYQPPPSQERQKESDQYNRDFEDREKERYREYQERRRAQRRAEQAAKETAQKAQEQTEARAKAARASTQSKTKQQQSQERTKASSQSSNQSQQKQKQQERKKPQSSASKTQYWYDVLGVSSTATEREIKKARNQLLRKYHSDRLKNNPDITPEVAKLKTQEINDAFRKGIAKYRNN